MTFLFVDLEYKGEDMSHSVNGRNFIIKDQKGEHGAAGGIQCA